MLAMAKPAPCHPARDFYAKGLCLRCYHQAYRAGKFERRSTRLPVEQTVPALPRTVVQRSHVFTAWPGACPHCHATTTLVQSGREVHCAGWRAGCGWVGYLVRVEALCGTSS